MNTIFIDDIDLLFKEDLYGPDYRPIKKGELYHCMVASREISYFDCVLDIIQATPIDHRIKFSAPISPNSRILILSDKITIYRKHFNLTADYYKIMVNQQVLNLVDSSWIGSKISL